MDRFIEALCYALIFSSLDANFEFWQFEIDTADRDKTVLTSHTRLFRFSKMVFGLQKAPSTFQ